jgi:manganese/iron transport system permease protein
VISRYFIDPFGAGYMQRALVEVVVLSLLAGVVSVHVLLRRLAFFGDAITHAVFPGVAIAFVLGQSLFLGAVAAGVLAAVLLTFATRLPRVDGDAALGVLLGAFFSIGVLVVSTRRTYTADLTALLFGRVLSVDRQTIVESLIVAVAVVATLALLHKELVLRAFDATAAAALGYRVVLLDLVLNVAVTLVVVASVRAAGTVLVIALVIIPAAAARLVTNRVGSMLIVSCAISVVCGFIGLAVSYDASVNHGVRLASGATIVLTLTAAFALAGALSFVLRHRSRRAALA